MPKVEAKVLKDRVVKYKKDAYRRSVDTLKNSIGHLEGLLKGSEPSRTI